MPPFFFRKFARTVAHETARVLGGTAIATGIGSAVDYAYEKISPSTAHDAKQHEPTNNSDAKTNDRPNFRN